MTREIAYAPILKWKTGEQKALQNLRINQKKRIAPILEIVDEQDTSSLLESIKDVAEGIDNSIGIDTQYIDNEDREILLALLDGATHIDHAIYPVIYPDDLSVIEQICDHSEEILFRLPIPADFIDEGYEDFFDKLQDLGLGDDTAVNFMLDLGVLRDRRDANLAFIELKNTLLTHFSGHTYTNIIISVSSFPEDLARVSAGEDTSFERFDMALFKKLYSGKDLNNIKDSLVFSDYGVTKFTESEIDFSRLRHGVLPKAKYTTANEYQVLKGERNHTFKTWVRGFNDIARTIYDAPYYYGEDFSYGDLDIKKRATGELGQGNSTNWVTICANHHIAVVLEELSTIFAV